MAVMGSSSSWKAPPGWRTRIRPAVFARYGHACWRCGAYATTVGHVVARSLGGTWDLSNLRPECSACNFSDGARLANRMRPRRPLTVAQRRAIGRKAAKVPTVTAPAPWITSRNW
jgi:5-methylcytosine-specific restriction endonuclease McrA